MTLQLGGAFSPDGSRVALATDAGEKDKPNWQIWVVEKKVKVCLAESHVDSQPAWSPLDQEIAYLVTAATPELAILDSETGASRVLKLPGIGFEQPPRWSPDGRTIALSHGARSVRILLVNAGDGRVRLLPAKGFLPTVDDSPVWSGDGQRLLLLSYDRLLGDQQALWMADVLRGSARRVCTLKLREGDVAVAAGFDRSSGDACYLTARPHSDGLAESASLFRYDSRSSAAVEVGRLSPSPGMKMELPCLSPDGNGMASTSFDPDFGKDIPNVLLWFRDGHSGQESLPPGTECSIVAWSRDGRHIAVSAWDGKEEKITAYEFSR